MAITNGFQVSPGVNIKETDLSQVIAAISTTDGALAGVYSWGPMKKRVLVSSEEEYVDTFGRPSNLNPETWFTGSLFLADSDSLYVSRAGNTSGASPSVFVTVAAGNNIVITSNTASLSVGMVVIGSEVGTIVKEATIASIINTTAFTLASGSQALFSNTDDIQFVSNSAVYSAFANTGPVSNLAGAIVLNDEDFIIKDGTFDPDIPYIAKYPGSRGNSIRVSRCDTANAFTSSVNLASFSATISLNVSSNTATVFIANTSPGANLSAAFASINTLANSLKAKFQITDQVEFGNSDIGFQSLSVTGLSNNTIVSPNAAYVSASFTVAFNDELKLIAAQNINTAVTRYWEFYDLVDQAPGQSTYMRNSGNTAANDELHLVVVDDGGQFTGTPGAVLEVYKSVSRARDAKTIDGGTNWYKNVINDQSQYIWVVNDRSFAPSNTALNLINSSSDQVVNLPFKFGRDGSDEASISIASISSAYDLFSSAEDVDISLVMTGLNRGGPNQSQLANYLIDNIAEIRKDVVVFVSPPRNAVVNNRGFEADACTEFRNALRSSSYGFLDGNYMYIYDRYNDIYRWVPCNGAIAGLAVRTDKTNDPWWSFAGFNRGQLKNVIKLAWNAKKADRDQLYKNNINPVNTFPGDGTVLYGDKTLQSKASSFDRINVRRLFIVLEKSIANYAKYSLFEFNDEITRALFKSRIIPYLRDIKGRRGITDFNVVCDTTNNTPQVIDTNRFVGSIQIKANRSINFITLNFVSVGTGVTFSEVSSTL
jgi:hypothetical protein